MSQAKAKSAASELSIGLNSNSRKEVVRCLSHLLADTHVLQLKTKYYHWNVTGPTFAGLHQLFDTQYTELAAAVDEVAERIRALGHFSPGTFREFSELTAVKEDKSLPEDWRAMVTNLAVAHETVIRNARQGLEKVQEAGDEGTADLIIRRLQDHEKIVWMLRSYLQ